MTVGQPEINLDTWGLRYVKKKKGDAIDLVGDAPTKSPQFGGGSELDSATATPSGRQNDSSGDTTGRYSSGGKKVGEQTHKHPSGRGEFQLKEPADDTIGSKRGEGATHGADTSPTGQGQAGQALTAGTRKKPVTTSAGLEGSKQTHTGSKGFDWARNPQTSRGGHSIKPAKQGEGSSAKPSKNIQRAALDLSIIKCKLLKMKTKKKDFIEEGRPTRPAYRKDDDEEEVEKGIYEKGTTYEVEEARAKESNKKEAEEQSPKADDGSPQGAKVSDKEIKDKKLDHIYRSDDIVDKAIELINEAYGEIKETKKAKDDYCRHCGSKKEHLDSEGKHTPQIEEGEGHDVPEVDRDSKGYAHRTGFEEGAEKKKVEDTENEAGVNLKNVIEDLKETKKEGADGGTNTTSTVGAANFVYSDVKEAEKQKQ
jgi:hypothetical protein